MGHRIFLLLAVITLLSCTKGGSEFEVVGIKLDSSSLDMARRVQPGLECNRRTILPLFDGYTECSVHGIDVASIRASLYVEANKEGIVTKISLQKSEPFDAPFHKWRDAMTEKYGPPTSVEAEKLVWM